MGMHVKQTIFPGLSLLGSLLVSVALAGPRAQASELRLLDHSDPLLAPISAEPGALRLAVADTFPAFEGETRILSTDTAPAASAADAPLHFSMSPPSMDSASSGAAPSGSAPQGEVFHFVGSNAGVEGAVPAVRVSEIDAKPALSPSAEDSPFRFRTPASEAYVAPLVSSEPITPVAQPEAVGESPYHFKVQLNVQ